MPEAADPYSIVAISELRVTERRGIVLLTARTGHLNAATEFKRIDTEKALTKRSKELRTRFDWWISGKSQNNWYHGWDAEEYRHCYCFKLNVKNVMHRFYGFVCHPQPETRPRFELCVLCFFDAKPGADTDKYYLRESMRLLSDKYVKIAISAHFSDIKKESNACH